MPVLNQNNFGTTFIAIPKMAEIFRAQLEAATGVSDKLNQSCKLGVDAILKDAIEGRVPEVACPCVRITWNSEQFLMPGTGGVLHTIVTLHLFFLYNIGKQSVSVLPVEFTALREQHIAWNLEYLKNKSVLPNNGIGFTDAQRKDDSGQYFWWWPDGVQLAPVQHETPFEVFGITEAVNPSSGFACSRVDINVVVKNHCTFNA